MKVCPTCGLARPHAMWCPERADLVDHPNPVRIKCPLCDGTVDVTDAPDRGLIPGADVRLSSHLARQHADWAIRTLADGARIREAS